MVVLVCFYQAFVGWRLLHFIECLVCVGGWFRRWFCVAAFVCSCFYGYLYVFVCILVGLLWC